MRLRSLLIALALALVATRSASAAAGPVFSFIFSHGFSSAQHLVVSPNGDVWVADIGNDRVLRFDNAGNFITETPVIAADGIACAADGSVWVLGGDLVTHLSANGDVLGSWGTHGSGEGEFFNAVEIAVDDSSNVYVSQVTNPKIQKFLADGTFVKSWGGPGSGDGQFDFPSGMVWTSGQELVVADQAHGQIQRFDRNGTLLGRWGVAGSAPGQLTSIGRPTFDGDDNLVVPEGSPADRISVFTLQGAFKLTWGSTGSGTLRQFRNPTCVGSASDGRLYVMDRDNRRVVVYAAVSTSAVPDSWGGVKRRFR